MRRFLGFIFCLGIGSAVGLSQTLSGLKICIDPGHGGYGSNDRHVVPDPGTNFYESESNFQKALLLKALLEELGAIVLLTRNSNSGVVYDNPLDPQEPSLSARWQFANANDVDWFHSIHSNAAGGTNTSVNRTLVLLKEDIPSRQPVFPEAIAMSGHIYNQIRAHLGTQSSVGNIAPGVYLDYTFYGGSNGGFNLGVLNGLTMPGELSEGSFHDFYPETRRLMNDAYRKLEAYGLRDAFMLYFGVPADTLAYIRGIQTEEGTGRLVNYSRVRLLPGDSVYVGDRFNNGFYLHDRLVPGNYTLIFETPGYEIDTLAFAATPGARLVQNIVLRPFGSPSPLAYFPQNGDTTFAANQVATIQFTKIMDTASIRNAFSISPYVEGSLIWSTNNTFLTFDPDSVVFPFDVWFTITIDSNARSADGNTFDGNGDGTAGDPFVLTFRPKPVDAWPPDFFSRRPDVNDTLRSSFELLNLTFDEPVQHSGVNLTNIALQQIGGSLQARTFQAFTFLGRTGVNVYLTNGLIAGKSYRIRVSGLADLAGNIIPNESAPLWEFTVSPKIYLRGLTDDFENGVGGWISPVTDSGSSGFDMDSTEWSATQDILISSISGNTSAASLRYKWVDTSSSAILRIRPDTGFAGIRAPRSRFQAYVWGDGSANTLRFSFLRKTSAEPGGLVFQSPEVTINWVGWRLVDHPLDIDSAGMTYADADSGGTVDLLSIDVSRGEFGASVSGRLLFDRVHIAAEFVTGVADRPEPVPTDYGLDQNFPNPFNPSTTVRFRIPLTGLVTLVVVDLLGRPVRTLVDGHVQAGVHEIELYMTGLASGTYIVELRAGDARLHRKVMLLK